MRRLTTLTRSGTSLIVCYHRVAAGVDDALTLCVQPDRFRIHLEEFCRLWQPSTLDAIGRPCKKPRLVVTLDDGYADSCWNALPIAEAAGVPLTVFVTSSQVDHHAGFWWDRMAALLRRRPPRVELVSVHVDGQSQEIRLGSGLTADCAALRSVLLPLPVVEIERILDEIGELWEVPSDAPQDARPLTSAELKTLADSSCAHVGAHTTEHVRLGGRPAAEQMATIAGSKRALELSTGREVRHFAYPFGGPQDFDGTSIECARAAGFRTACTTLPGVVHAVTDPHRLPRRLVMDWTRSRLRAQLLRWQLW